MKQDLPYDTQIVNNSVPSNKNLRRKYKMLKLTQPQLKIKEFQLDKMPTYSCHVKGRESRECFRKNIIIDFIPKITAEEPIII
jgi:hypothetical protein